MTAESITDVFDPMRKRAEGRIGTRLRGKWRLDRLLGVGGMAAVYEGVHRNGKKGAVKILHTELSLDSHLRARFLREGYVANKVGHPGAVSVLDDDVCDDGAVFLVMELLEGESLDHRMRRMGGRLEPGEVLSIGDQLLDALAAAHDKGIVHRDLKPENVFITVDGVVKVLDFGIARLRELTTASTATQSGMTFGTPAYMPPEQAQGHANEVDARSDIWAVGATLFTLLSGRLVHEGSTVNETLIKAGTQQARPILSVRPDLPPRVGELVDRALAFDKGDRWPDARTMQRRLRRVYHSTHGAPITTALKLGAPAADRTQPSPGIVGAVSPPGAVKTNEPVSSGKSGVSLRSITKFSPVTVAVVGAGSLALIAVGGVVAVRAWASRATLAPASVPAAITTSAPPAIEAPPVRAGEPAPTTAPSPSAIAVEDLPATTTKSKTKKPPAGSVSSARPAPSSSARPPLPHPAETDWQDRRR